MANTFADSESMIGNNQGKAAEFIGRSRTKNGQDGSAAKVSSK